MYIASRVFPMDKKTAEDDVADSEVGVLGGGSATQVHLTEENLASTLPLLISPLRNQNNLYLLQTAGRYFPAFRW